MEGGAESEAGKANAQVENRPGPFQAEVYGERQEQQAQQKYAPRCVLAEALGKPHGAYLVLVGTGQDPATIDAASMRARSQLRVSMGAGA